MSDDGREKPGTGGVTSSVKAKGPVCEDAAGLYTFR